MRQGRSTINAKNADTPLLYSGAAEEFLATDVKPGRLPASR